MPARHLFVGLLVCVAPAAWAADPAPPEKPSPEENILKKAGVPTDGDGLLAFFPGRTLSDAERNRIGALIRRLGGDDLEDREAAAKELRKVGGRATPLLPEATHSKAAEIAQRVKQLLKGIDPLPAAAPPAAMR